MSGTVAICAEEACILRCFGVPPPYPNMNRRRLCIRLSPQIFCGLWYGSFIESVGGCNLSLRWIPVLVCAGAIYIAFGQTFHANLITSPETTIMDLGRSITDAVTGTVSMLREMLWS